MTRLGAVAELLRRGDVFYNIVGEKPDDVLKAFVKVLRVPKALDKKALADALVERESLATTAIGNGFAIPHSRARLLKDESSAFIAVGYLDNSIPWNSPDGEPVSTLFLLVSAEGTQHLSALAGIACLADNGRFKDYISEQPAKAELLQFIASMESCPPA
ncbi:MAG: PTS sugar transporter subunit IIA [Rectinemataceae bacterium]|nr:PTS sugar transporter subunit IIA [Rectinemataceae bacterium]